MNRSILVVFFGVSLFLAVKLEAQKHDLRLVI
jgi:hypothetical protein